MDDDLYYYVAFDIHAARVLLMLTSNIDALRSRPIERDVSGFWRSPSLISPLVQIVLQRL